MLCYFDDFFAGVVSKPLQLYQQVEQLPHGCAVIGHTLYNSDYRQHLTTVEFLLARTQHLILVVDEPTDGVKSFHGFLQSLNDPRITIFSPTVLNFEQPNHCSAMTWFDSGVNYYASAPWAKNLLADLDFNFDKIKKFDCLLGLSKPNRDELEKHYLQCSFKDQFVYSYFKKDISQGLWNTDVSNIEYSSQSVPWDGQPVRLSAILPVDIYNQTYYSVVAETSFKNSYSHYTEKTAKPIVARRPFVTFCGQHFLKNLRSLGFQTFDGVIDESYDSIADLKQRTARAWQQVELLCAMDPAWVYRQLEPVLEHNYRHFINTDWHSNLKQLVDKVGFEPTQPK